MTTLADLIAQAMPPTRLLDALAADPVTCACGNPGAKPRRWNSPAGPRGGFFCDPCEALLVEARQWLEWRRPYTAASVLRRAS